ncbi:MAG: hypothetical protein LBV60_02495 [Streptomyces sp.]|jgi:hypothetical protein|nr:hypothetical protein [Streptomyces sp.]
MSTGHDPYADAIPVSLDTVWSRTCVQCREYGYPHVFVIIVNGAPHLRCDNCGIAMVARPIFPKI